MSVQRKVKMSCVFVLAAVLLLTVLLAGQGTLETQAAGGIDLNKDYNLTVTVDRNDTGGNNSQYLGNFDKMDILVSVYKIAELDTTGQVSNATDAFKDLDADVRSYGSASNDEKKALAEWAKEIVETGNLSAEKEITVRAKSGATSVTGQITGLKAGLYLVVPKDKSGETDYTFLNSLAAIPNASSIQEGGSGDVSIGLKPGGITPPPEGSYGKLKITKNLQDFNASLGRTTFVFKIVGVDVHGTTKYDEVASLDFDAPGSKTITLDNIPAGLKVTVTEVYSGASYEVVGSDEATVVIVSDEQVRLGKGEVASVSFTNRYNGKNRVGYGVDNRFKSDGKDGWIWETSTKTVSE